MCIVSNWVNEAQDLIAVKKYDDLPNSLLPSCHPCIDFPFLQLSTDTPHSV